MIDWLRDEVQQLKADIAAIKAQLARTDPHWDAPADPALDYPSELEPSPAQTEAARDGDDIGAGQ